METMLLDKLDDIQVFNEYQTAMAMVEYYNKMLYMESYVQEAAGTAEKKSGILNKIGNAIAKGIDAIIKALRNISNKLSNKSGEEKLKRYYDQKESEGVDADAATEELVEAIANQEGEKVDEETLADIREFLKKYHASGKLVVSYNEDAAKGFLLFADNLNRLSEFLLRCDPSKKAEAQKLINGINNAIRTVETNINRKDKQCDPGYAHGIFSEVEKAANNFKVKSGEALSKTDNPETKEFINSIIQSAGVGGVLQTFGKVTGFMNKPVKEKSIIINALGSLIDATKSVFGRHVTGKDKGRMDNVVKAREKYKRAGKKVGELDQNGSVKDTLKQVQQNRKGIDTITDFNNKKEQSDAISDQLGAYGKYTTTDVENYPKKAKRGLFDKLSRKKRTQQMIDNTTTISEPVEFDDIPPELKQSYENMSR